MLGIKLCPTDRLVKLNGGPHAGRLVPIPGDGLGILIEINSHGYRSQYAKICGTDDYTFKPPIEFVGERKGTPAEPLDTWIEGFTVIDGQIVGVRMYCDARGSWNQRPSFRSHVVA